MAIAVRWFPQSFVQVRSGDRTVYIDPAMGTSFLSLLRSALPPYGRNTKLPEDMGPSELMLVTHPHGDHLAKGLVERLSRPDTEVIAPESCRKKLGARMTAVVPGVTRDAKGIGIEVVHAYNPEGSRKVSYHPKGMGVGYVLTIEGRRVYHAGDTGLIDEMKALGPVDLALLPIGGRFTMDVEEAIEAVRMIRPSIVVPMHRLKADPQAFAERVSKESGTRTEVLSPGGTLMLEGKDERPSN
jgi:L-ascorbate metabolism protein UlaG (beta-lactamase superfamily)